MTSTEALGRRTVWISPRKKLDVLCAGLGGVAAGKASISFHVEPIYEARGTDAAGGIGDVYAAARARSRTISPGRSSATSPEGQLLGLVSSRRHSPSTSLAQARLLLDEREVGVRL